MGGRARISYLRFARELAQIWGGWIGLLGPSGSLCHAEITAAVQTRPSVTYRLKRYPSPDRCMSFLHVPVIPTARPPRKFRNLSAVSASDHKGAADAPAMNTERENMICSRHQPFWRQSLSLALRLVRRTPTLKTHLLARAHVLPHLHCPTNPIVTPHWPQRAVQQLAHWPTISASLSKSFAPFAGVTHRIPTAQGACPVRFFASERHLTHV